MFVVMFEDKDISDIMWSEFLRKVARAGHRSPDFEESLVSILKEIPKDSDRFERLVLFMSKLGECKKIEIYLWVESRPLE